MSEPTPNSGVTLEAVLKELERLRLDHEELVEDVKAALADRAIVSVNAAREVFRIVEIDRRVHGFANRLTSVMAECSTLKDQAAEKKQ